MIHHLDLCRWFAESPVVAVQSRERYFLGKDHPSSLWVLLEFGNGCIATLESGWIFETDGPSFEEDGIEIVTERERIHLAWPSNGCELRHAEGVERIDRSYVEALRFELEHWVGCVGKTSQSPVVSAEEGVEAVALAERIIAAAGKDRFPNTNDAPKRA